MMYGNECVAANSKIRGRKKIYDCWEFRFSDLARLEGSSLVCIASYRTLPAADHIISAGYFESLEHFKAEARKIQHIIYSFVFISSSPGESEKIIRDILAGNKK